MIAAPGLWDDPDRARDVMRKHRRAQEELDTWTKLATDAEAVVGLIELLDPADVSIIEEIASEISSLETQLASLELQLMLGGEYDEHDAFLTIQSGAGGTESQDWAEMLLRMYSRWTDKRAFHGEVIEASPGEEAGIKNATLQVSGRYAYGHLKAERGVHRLVRQSPFDASNRRHTSFARVDIVPVLEDSEEIAVSPDEIRTETFRSSGAGGNTSTKPILPCESPIFRATSWSHARTRNPNTRTAKWRCRCFRHDCLKNRSLNGRLNKRVFGAKPRRLTLGVRSARMSSILTG